MTCDSSVTWKFLWTVFSIIFMKPLLPCGLGSVWVSEGAELDPGNPRQHFEWILVFCICLKARRLPLPQQYFQDVTHRCVTGCSCSRAGTEPLAMWENQRQGAVPWGTLGYPGVTAPGLGCSLFIGRGRKCNDDARWSVSKDLLYIRERGGKEKGKEGEKEKIPCIPET